MKTFRKLSVLFSCFLVAQLIGATVINSVKSGSWSDASTWDGSVPNTNTDTVYIKSGHTVTSLVGSATTYTVASLIVENDAVLQASGASVNMQFNIKRDVICDGIIELGQAGDGINAAYFQFSNGGGLNQTFSGTGSAKLRTIQHTANANMTLTISLPEIEVKEDLFETAANGKIKIESACTVKPLTGTSALALSCGGSKGNGANAGGSIEISGKVEACNLFLGNKAGSGNKNSLEVKSGGELKITGTITTIKAGTGIDFSVKNGGKFNYPALNNPADYMNSSHEQYYNNLSVVYENGSIINGATTGGGTTVLYNRIDSESLPYVADKVLVFPKTVDSVSIFNMRGQCVYNRDMQKSNVDLSAYSGVLLVRVRLDGIEQSCKVLL